MHKLIEYICGELEDLEKKASKSGSLSASDIEYAEKLSDIKKNLLKGEMLYDEVMDGSEYSERMMDGGISYARGGSRGGRDGGSSYARGRRNAKRDSMGRYSRESGGYSRAADDMIERLRDLMDEAPDDMSRKEIERLIKKMEQM